MSVSGAAYDDAPASVPVRLAVGLLGIIVLLLAIASTVGMALAAPIGVGAAWLVQRWRGRRLSRLGSWSAAVIGASVLAGVSLAMLMAQVPDGVFEKAMAEAQASEPPPLPGWLERLAPPEARGTAALDPLMDSPETMLAMQAIGAAIGVLIMGGFIGTMGWGVLLLLGFAVGGRWPFASESAPVPID